MQIDRGTVEKITPTRLVEAALVDISDAERCQALHITPATGTLLRRLREVTAALSETLEGVYETYRQLGEDTDGARNARDLFGPMTDMGNPAAWVARLVAEHRAEYEADADIARGVALTEARNRLFDTAMPTEVCKMVEGYLDELIAEDFSDDR